MKPATPRNRSPHTLFVSNHGPYEAAWFKWEFLRRNSVYRTDYGKFMNSFGHWLKRKGQWHDLERRAKWTKSEERYFRSAIEPTLMELCHKWQIFDLFSPDWGFEQARTAGKSGTREFYPPTGIPPESIRDYSVGLGTARTLHGPAKRHQNVLTVEFDLNWPLKDGLRYMKAVWKAAQRSYVDEVIERGETVGKGRRRIKDYITHLRIWDLKYQGKTLSEIAEIVFPSDRKDSVRQRVRDHLDAAESLIAGRYEEIR